MDGFPADWTPGRVQRILDDIPYLRRHPELEHRAALLIYDSLARWANIPSVLVKPEQREFRFNDAYLNRNCEDPGALAACNLLDYWVVRRTDKQVLILDFPSKALDGLVYSLTSPQPSR